jgi:hypothetical protein
MNIKEAIARACEYDSLSDALTSIALWKTNQYEDADIDSTWGKCFDAVLAEHPKVQWQKKDSIVKDRLSKIDCVDGIFRSGDKYYALVKEYDSIDYYKDLFDFEDRLNVEISVRAHQGRNVNKMFPSSSKIWVRGESD